MNNRYKPQEAQAVMDWSRTVLAELPEKIVKALETRAAAISPSLAHELRTDAEFREQTVALTEVISLSLASRATELGVGNYMSLIILLARMYPVEGAAYDNLPAAFKDILGSDFDPVRAGVRWRGMEDEARGHAPHDGPSPTPGFPREIQKLIEHIIGDGHEVSVLHVDLDADGKVERVTPGTFGGEDGDQRPNNVRNMFDAAALMQEPIRNKKDGE